MGACAVCDAAIAMHLHHARALRGRVADVANEQYVSLIMAQIAAGVGVAGALYAMSSSTPSHIASVLLSALVCWFFLVVAVREGRWIAQARRPYEEWLDAATPPGVLCDHVEGDGRVPEVLHRETAPDAPDLCAECEALAPSRRERRVETLTIGGVAVTFPAYVRVCLACGRDRDDPALDSESLARARAGARQKG